MSRCAWGRRQEQGIQAEGAVWEGAQDSAQKNVFHSCDKIYINIYCFSNNLSVGQETIACGI